jgi:type I restriction enzyme, S subunit
MKRYDSYKDSGVKWIGEIPNHWKLITNKYFTKSQKNKSEFGDEILLSVSEYQGVIPRRNIREGEEHLSRSESLVGYLKVRKGELVSNIMLMWKRGLGVSEYEGIVSPSYSVFSFKKSEPKYFHYLYRTDQYVSEFRRNSTGVIESRLRLYDDSFGSLKSHFPPLSEQQQIVSFLDTKTSLIDSLIEKTQRKIELLKEKRTSFINEVVTKGLNPNVEMKDSGVEWIGEIPSHWETVRLKYVCSVTTGGKDTQDKVDDGLYPFYVRSPKIERINSYSFDGESVLTVGDGVGVGKVFHYVEGKFEFHQRVYKFSEFKRLTGKFFFWFIKHHFIFVTEDQNSKSTVDSLRRPLIDEFPFVNPPLSEQQQIVSYLDEQTQLIDKTISIEIKRIELLKEYRQSLISEVVTGKRKVV